VCLCLCVCGGGGGTCASAVWLFCRKKMAGISSVPTFSAEAFGARSQAALLGLNCPRALLALPFLRLTYWDGLKSTTRRLTTMGFIHT
jgi:hypothetical protein